MTYCFDANAFIGPWRRTYPPDVFPAYWEQIAELIADGDIKIISEAFQELEIGGDDLFKWVKARSNAVVKLNEPIQQAARDLLQRFPGMINIRKQKSMADPFVVAHAQVIGGIVVTEESGSGDPRHPRIPDVCRAINVECM